MNKKKILKNTLASLLAWSVCSSFNIRSNIPIKLEEITLEPEIKIEETVKSENRDELYSLVDDVYRGFEEIPEYINREFIREAIRIESTDNAKAISKKGARGLMQITYGAWKEVEKELNYHQHVFDPQANIRVGLKYLLWINDYCESRHPKWNTLSNEEKRRKIMASYNGGPSRLSSRNWNINRMSGETREYVDKIERGMGQ